MKKNILALAFVGSLAMVMVGCGGDDKKKEVKIEDVVLEYKSEGAYDLSKYIAPAQSQVNNYVKKSYTNNKGERKYSPTPDSEEDVSYTYDVNSTGVTEIESLYNDKTTYNFLDDRIDSTDSNDSAFSGGIVRYADAGDNIFKVIASQSKDGINFDITYLCKVNKYLSSRKVRNTIYDDVLEITCTGSTEADSTVFTLTSKDYSTSYFSYEVGLIEEIEETCDTTTVKNNITKECEKETMEITTIN